MTMFSSAAIVAVGAMLAAFLLMLAELRLSTRNERALRDAGALEPPDDVYPIMSWAYPVAFAVIGVEGGLFGRSPGATTLLGAAVFFLAKALKYWAMASLGPRWSFRVLVVPGAPLVTRGPYARLRHPNYVGVIGELAGFALLVGAPVSGVVSVAGFAFLIRRRIQIEERALGIAPPLS
jgi:methyltransferase